MSPRKNGTYGSAMSRSVSLIILFGSAIVMVEDIVD